jgi:ligand-binding sensor domain-containing protein
MNQLILLIAILIPFTSCNQESSKPIAVDESFSIAKEPPILNLQFTKGIRSIFQDSKGNYWFGSNHEGVCLYDGESFKYWTSTEGLADNQIIDIQEDVNGRIWLQTANGISSYDGQNITNHTIIENPDSQNEWMKRDSDLWFNAGNKEGVYRCDGHSINYLAFPSPKVINPDNVYFVTAIADRKHGMLWIATYAGIFGYNSEGFTIINDETLGLKEETGELHIRSILEDSKGLLWIGNNGLGVLLKDNDAIINFSEQKNLIHPTSLNRSTTMRGDQSQAGTLEHVFAIEEDKEGNIWFGDRDTGIWKYDGKTIKNVINNLGVANDFAHTIYKDNDGELWFLMTKGSVFKLNRNIFTKQF